MFPAGSTIFQIKTLVETMMRREGRVSMKHKHMTYNDRKKVHTAVQEAMSRINTVKTFDEPIINYDDYSIDHIRESQESLRIGNIFAGVFECLFRAAASNSE